MYYPQTTFLDLEEKTGPQPVYINKGTGKQHNLQAREGLHGNSVAKRNNIRYNAKKDAWLRSPADNALNKKALRVEEPNWKECGGMQIKSEAHYKEVPGLTQARIDELTEHMKPMKHRDRNGFYRSPEEIRHIRQIQVCVPPLWPSLLWA